MQKRGTSRSKGGPDLQRDGGVAQREAAAREAKRPTRSSSRDDISLSGQPEGALTLATLYDTGAFERMRLEVRVRLLADVAQSLATLHSNERLMETQPYLGLMPSTVVIGLDGVARIDVRAAKKRELDTAYAAPEVLKADARADHRADIYSLGIVAWEALSGARLGSKLLAPIGGARPKPARRATEARAERPEPVVLGGAMVSRRREAFDVNTPSDDEPRAGNGNGAAGVSGQRVRVPFPTLPPEAAWAQPLGQIAVKALNPDPKQRPQDTSVVLEELGALDASHFATHNEIADVVQGIASVSSLYTPEPGPPRTDQKCQPSAPRGVEVRRGLKGCAIEAPDTVIICVQPPAAYHSLQPPAPAVMPVPAPKIIEVERVTPVHKPPQKPRRQSLLAAYPRSVWLGVGLLWILTFGLLVGYFARAMLPQ
jgi:serine/threonine protein kinase